MDQDRNPVLRLYALLCSLLKRKQEEGKAVQGPPQNKAIMRSPENKARVK